MRLTPLIVSIHQPAYLPWLGYFDRIAASDVFVFLDTVQFEKNSYTNRNRIKTATGPMWLTVPVLTKGHLDKSIADIKIDASKGWDRKHLRAVEQNYRNARRYRECFPRFEALYGDHNDGLADLCYEHLRFWLAEFRIRTRVVRASELSPPGTKSDLVVAICKMLGATGYLSGPLGRDYLDESAFQVAAIKVGYHEFSHPTYSQLYGPFAPAMAVVDYWMNDGSPEIFKKENRAA